jgi:hypothetical protein
MEYEEVKKQLENIVRETEFYLNNPTANTAGLEEKITFAENMLTGLEAGQHLSLYTKFENIHLLLEKIRNSGSP